MAFLEPLPPETTPELADTFAQFQNILGFVPNSLLTMQRKPAMVLGFGVLTGAVMAPDSEVDLGFKRLLAHFCSRAAGRSEEHTSDLQSLMRISYAVFYLKTKKKQQTSYNNPIEL